MPNAPQSIADRQQEIVASFALLGSDREAMLHYLIERGQSLPPFPEQYRTSTYLIPGCLSRVWLACAPQGKVLYFYADSNTAITKGLAALLLKLFSGQTSQAILAAKPCFVQALQLQNLLGAQRANGQAKIVQQFRRYALAHQLHTDPKSINK